MTAPFTGSGSATATAFVPGFALFGGVGDLSDTLTIVEPLAESWSATGSLTMTTGEPYPELGEFPDWEQVAIDGLTPITYTCSTLPPTDEKLQAALPLIQARRIGGKLDVNAITDTAVMSFMVFALKRSQAQRIATQVREAVLSWPGTTINGVLVDWAEERIGNQEIMDLDQLNRVVEVCFRLDARRQ